MNNIKLNTSELQNLLDKIKKLPEAGGGRTVETCTVNLTTSVTIYSISFMALDDSGNIIHQCIKPNSTASQTFTCLCNSVVDISHNNSRGLSWTDTPDYNTLVTRAYYVSYGLKASDGDIVELSVSQGGSAGGAG